MKRIAIIITGIIISLTALTGCGDKPKTNSQAEGQAQTEQAFEQQSKAVPYPASELRDSLERRNLAKRLLTTNDPDKLGYVYLLNFGKIFGYYTIQGKVSSTQSQMTTSDLINYACSDGLSGCQAVTTTAPSDDGSYGENEAGIFFFTTEDAYVTTNLDYMYSDQPLPFDVPELNSTK